MNVLNAVLNRYKRYIGSYTITLLLMLTACIIIVATSIRNHTAIHAIAYIGGVVLCMFITDIVIEAFPKNSNDFPVKQSLKKELWTIIICALLGAAFLVIRFFTDWQHLQPYVRISALPLLLFTFPIVLAIIYLFVFKYKFKELGVNLNYWYLPIILHIVWGCITLLAAPEVSHWQEAFREYGIISMLVTGIFSAALSEEFTRLLWQTRMGKAINNPAFGIFIATVVWGAMHIPVDHSQTHKPVTLWSSIEIIAYLMPIGVFWGYLTARTKSLFPAVMMHGFNLWGLQNF